MSWSKYQQQIHRQLLLNKVQQSAIQGKVNVTKEQVKRFIAKHAAQLHSQTGYQYSDLLIPTSSQVSVAQASSLAQQVVKAWRTDKSDCSTSCIATIGTGKISTV